MKSNMKKIAVVIGILAFVVLISACKGVEKCPAYGKVNAKTEKAG